MLRNFSLIKMPESDSVATWHVWNQYIDWLNSDIDSLRDYLDYFNPDYVLLNETLYATAEDGTEITIPALLEIEGTDIDTTMYQLGIKAHCYVYHYASNDITEDFMQNVSYRPGVKSNTETLYQYLVDDEGTIWYAEKVERNESGTITKCTDYAQGGNEWGELLSTVEVYTLYLPALLHFHQGILNTDSNSLLFYGTSTAWKNAGGDVITGSKCDYYFINYDQYILLKENSTAESTAFRLWDTSVPLLEANYANKGLFELTAKQADGSIVKGIGLLDTTPQSTTQIYTLDQIRVKDVDTLTYYYTYTQLVPLRDFPVATVIISNAQTETGTDSPSSVERQDPNNYILMPRGSPSIYSVSFKDNFIIYTYDEGVVSAGVDSIFFAMDLWAPRYSNYNSANQFWTAGSYYMQIPAAFYSAVWQVIPTIYIADKNNRIWSNTFPLDHELLYIHEGQSAFETADSTLTIDNFICDEYWSSGLSNVANKIVSYYNINIRNNGEAMMDYSSTNPHIFINLY